MVNIYGVIYCLVVALDDTDRTFGLAGGVEDDDLEEFGVDLVGAGAGEEKAARGKELHRETVEICVGVLGLVDVARALGEGGGIEDDEIVGARGRGFAEVEEDVLDGRTETFGFDVVECYVLFCFGDGLFVVIHRICSLCSSSKCGEREAADVAATV